VRVESLLAGYQKFLSCFSYLRSILATLKRHQPEPNLILYHLTVDQYRNCKNICIWNWCRRRFMLVTTLMLVNNIRFRFLTWYLHWESHQNNDSVTNILNLSPSSSHHGHRGQFKYRWVRTYLDRTSLYSLELGRNWLVHNFSPSPIFIVRPSGKSKLWLRRAPVSLSTSNRALFSIKSRKYSRSEND